MRINLDTYSHAMANVKILSIRIIANFLTQSDFYFNFFKCFTRQANVSNSLRWQGNENCIAKI